MSFLLSFWCALLFVVAQINVAGAGNVLLVWATGAMAILLFLFGAQCPFLRTGVRHFLALLLGITVAVIGGGELWMHAPSYLPFLTISGAVWFVGVHIAEWIFAPRDRGTMAPADSDPRLVFVPSDWELPRPA